MYDYYAHKNMCRIANYFGEIGEPIKISRYVYYLLKLLRYRVTKVPPGTSTTDVRVRAALNMGAHPDSYFVKMQRIQYRE